MRDKFRWNDEGNFESRDKTLYCALKLNGFNILNDNTYWDDKNSSMYYIVNVGKDEERVKIEDIVGLFLSRTLSLNTYGYDRESTNFKRMLDKYRSR